MKTCSRCKIEKELIEFYKNKNKKCGYQSACKNCDKSTKKPQIQNYYLYKDYFKQHHTNNKEKRKNYTKQQREKNKEKWKEYDSKWKKSKRDNNLEYKIKCNLMTRINYSVKKYNKTKKESSITELGCSIKYYIEYLEKQFDENMNWENYGKDKYWEIDHTQPLSKGGSFYYTNTRPLKISENRIKGNRI
jgi:hypothetical protein